MKELTPAELRTLGATTDLPTLGRAFGISEPVARERLHRGDWAALGIRIHRLGWKYRVITADVLRVLGVTPETGAASPSAGSAGQPTPSGDIP